VTNESPGRVEAAISHEFASGQKVFGRYDIHLFVNQHGFDWKLSNFHRQHPRRVRANFIGFFRERDIADAATGSSAVRAERSRGIQGQEYSR
jgi:hypothetical protein